MPKIVKCNRTMCIYHSSKGECKNENLIIEVEDNGCAATGLAICAESKEDSVNRG